MNCTKTKKLKQNVYKSVSSSVIHSCIKLFIRYWQSMVGVLWKKVSNLFGNTKIMRQMWPANLHNNCLIQKNSHHLRDIYWANPVVGFSRKFVWVASLKYLLRVTLIQSFNLFLMEICFESIRVHRLRCGTWLCQFCFLSVSLHPLL